MMFLYRPDYGRWQFVDLSQADTLLYVRNNYKGAHAWSKVIVRVVTQSDVFHKEFWFDKFAYVVKVGRHSCQQGISTNFISRSLCKICHQQAVMISAGS